MLVFVMVCISLCPSSFAIILKKKRELVALLLLAYGCLVTVNILWFFLTVPWVGLQCVIVIIFTYFRNHSVSHIQNSLILFSFFVLLS